MAIAPTDDGWLLGKLMMARVMSRHMVELLEDVGHGRRGVGFGGLGGVGVVWSRVWKGRKDGALVLRYSSY